MRIIPSLTPSRGVRIIRSMNKRQGEYAVMRLLFLLDARGALLTADNKARRRAYENMASMLAEALTRPHTHAKRAKRRAWPMPNGGV